MTKIDGQPAHAASTNGAIYYSRFNFQAGSTTYAINEDGSSTTTPTPLTATSDPHAFALDGTKIAYVSRSSGFPTTYTLRVAGPDGSGAISIFSGSTRISELRFGHDGNKIYAAIDKTIYEFDATTADQTLSGRAVLTVTAPSSISTFDISSTGKIAYSSYATCGSTGFGILVRDLTATGVGTFVPGSCEPQTGQNNAEVHGTRVVWSPDGSKMYVAQVTISDGASGRVRSNLVIDEFTTAGKVSNTPLYQHVGNNLEIYNLAISPDGTKIVFFVVVRTSPETPVGLSVLNIGTRNATQILPLTTNPSYLSWGPILVSPSAPSLAETPTSTAAPTTAAPTTVAATTTAAPTTTVSTVFANAVPGVTKTDTKIYTQPPAEVAASSAINVLTSAQNKVMDVQTKTPAVCLPNDDELVFIDEGRCIAEVVNTKTRAVLRTLRTTVVDDDIAELKIGNEIVTLAPIYFDTMSATLDDKAMARVKSLKSRVSAAGSVLLVGHSGTLNGNSPENIAISRARAASTLAALKSIGAKGPFAVSGVGALDPARTGKTQADQAKNRRVVIILVP